MQGSKSARTRRLVGVVAPKMKGPLVLKGWPFRISHHAMIYVLPPCTQNQLNLESTLQLQSVALIINDTIRVRQYAEQYCQIATVTLPLHERR
jgi:hypothetical protein